MKNETIEKGEPAPLSREEKIKEKLDFEGVDGRLIKSEEFDSYYFFPSADHDIYFKIETLCIRRLG